MEQPKKGTAKDIANNVSVPVEFKLMEDVEEEESDDLEEQLRIVNLVCDAVDLLGSLLLFLLPLLTRIAVMAFL